MSGIRDAMNGFWLGLRKGPVIPVINNTGGMIAVNSVPSVVDVVNTLQSPDNSNVPWKWSQAFMGPGRPFAGNMSTRTMDAEKEPRSFQYIPNVNATIAPRISWGLTPFAELRNAAENVPEVAGVVTLIMDEMKAFNPIIVDQDEKEIDIPELKWMLEQPDRANPWPVWLSRFLYNVLVYDAPALYKMREDDYISYRPQANFSKVSLITTAPSDAALPASAMLRWTCGACETHNYFPLTANIAKNLDGPVICDNCRQPANDETMGQLTGRSLQKSGGLPPVVGLRIIDGSTLFVLIDERGESPEPPAPAFTQVIYGTPRMFLNKHQVWYRPRYLRADAPYGRSFIESSMASVQLLANLWAYEGAKYQSGNLPEMGMECPPTWTNAEQILNYEEAYNSRMAGAPEERAGRMRFFPSGMKSIVVKDLVFNKDAYDVTVNTIRMAAGVPKSEAGEAPEGMMGGKSFAEAMQSAFYRMCLAPMQAFIEGLFNDILRENGYTDYRFKLKFPTESIDPEKEENKWATRFQLGGITRDEYREGLSMTPLGGELGQFIVEPGGAQPGADDGSGMGQQAFGKKPALSNPIGVMRNPISVLSKPVAVKLNKGREEDKHPRADDGKFGSGGGAAGGRAENNEGDPGDKRAKIKGKGASTRQAMEIIQMQAYGAPPKHVEQYMKENGIDYVEAYHATSTEGARQIERNGIKTSPQSDRPDAAYFFLDRKDIERNANNLGLGHKGEEDYAVVTIRIPREKAANIRDDGLYNGSFESSYSAARLLESIPPEWIHGTAPLSSKITKALMSSLSALCPSWCDPAEFTMGMSIEQEHDDAVEWDQETIAQIVIDHLRETPDYYTRLAHMEAEAEEADAEQVDDSLEKDGDLGMTTENGPNGVYLVGQEKDSDYSEYESEPESLKKFYPILRKHCGVCAADDQLFGAAVTKRLDVPIIPHGANQHEVVSIGEGEIERPAVWKPESGTKAGLRDWAGGDLCKRAEAAYLLDRELSPNADSYLVPVTYVTDLDGQLGSVQHYVKGATPKRLVTEYAPEYIEQAAVLDYVMGQMDRIKKNYLTHPDDDTRPVLIDNDISFRPNDDYAGRSDFVEAMRGKMLSSETKEALYLAIGNRGLWDDLADCLSDEMAVEMAKARAQSLYDDGSIRWNYENGPDDDGTNDDDDDDLNKADWKESEHPRADNGEFGAGGGGHTAGTKKRPQGTLIDEYEGWGLTAQQGKNEVFNPGREDLQPKLVDVAVRGIGKEPDAARPQRAITDLSDDEYKTILDEAKDWSYLVFNNGGMGRKSDMEDWLTARYNIDRSAGHTISNGLEQTNNPRFWREGRPEPKLSDYPGLNPKKPGTPTDIPAAAPTPEAPEPTPASPKPEPEKAPEPKPAEKPEPKAPGRMPITPESWIKGGWANASTESKPHTDSTKARVTRLVSAIKSGTVKPVMVTGKSLYFPGEGNDEIRAWVEGGGMKMAYVKDGQRVGDIAGSFDDLKPKADAKPPKEPAPEPPKPEPAPAPAPKKEKAPKAEAYATRDSLFADLDDDRKKYRTGDIFRRSAVDVYDELSAGGVYVPGEHNAVLRSEEAGSENRQRTSTNPQWYKDWFNQVSRNDKSKASQLKSKAMAAANAIVEGTEDKYFAASRDKAFAYNVYQTVENQIYGRASKEFAGSAGGMSPAELWNEGMKDDAFQRVFDDETEGFDYSVGMTEDQKNEFDVSYMDWLDAKQAKIDAMVRHIEKPSEMSSAFFPTPKKVSYE